MFFFIELTKKTSIPPPLPTLTWSAFVKHPENNNSMNLVVYSLFFLFFYSNLIFNPLDNDENNKKYQEVFLTESDVTMSLTPSLINDDPEKLEPVSENNSTSISKETMSQSHIENLETTEWDSRIPLTHQLRQKTNYDQIYTL